MRRRARVATAALIVIGAAIGALYLIGSTLIKPARMTIGAPPADLHAQLVRIPVGGGDIVGWLVVGKPRSGAVLLLHGVRANRQQMLARARFLERLGYSVLLIDLQAHGESGGTHMGFGALEAEGVTASIKTMRRVFPGERIGVIGVSLGAASLVLSRPNPAVDALVLESMYPTIDEAVANRLAIRLGVPGRWMSPLLVQQLPLRVGISPAMLRPVDAVQSLISPTLVIGGNEDRQTPPAETRRIAEALAGPKALWLIEGAGHVDLHALAPGQYETRVGDFLASRLRAPPP